MKVLIVSGGTAGHINPGLAIADKIKANRKDAKIFFAGSGSGMEAKLVPKAGFEFFPFDVAGFQRKLNYKNIKRNLSALVKVFTASFQAEKLLLKLEPDIVVGTGGYVSGPVLRKAAKMGIKTAIHEQNAFPGVTTKLLSKYVTAVMLANEDAKKHLKGTREFFITGNPVREAVILADKKASRRKMELDNRPVILSFGGSLGAKRINETIAEVIAWHMKEGTCQHIHATGKFGIEWMPELLESKGVDLHSKNLRLFEYIDNMDECMAAADIVICRSGAIALSELQVQGKPSILIPSPNVSENHQYHNALSLQNKGAAIVIEEKDLSGSRLIEELKALLADHTKLEEMGRNARNLAVYDACDRIYEVIMKTMGDHPLN